MLADSPGVADEEVQDQTGREAQRDEPEEDGQDLHDRAHLLVRLRGARLGLLGLQVAGDHHQGHQDEERDRGPHAAVGVGGGLLEVDAEELEVGEVGGGARLVEDVVGVVAEGLVQARERALLGDVLIGVPEDAEEGEEDRELHHERQAPGERVDLVLLVELHDLFVELLAVALVFRLELLDLGLDPLHGEHRLRLLGRERVEHEHHGEGHQDDGDAEVRDQRVEERQHRA